MNNTIKHPDHFSQAAVNVLNLHLAALEFFKDKEALPAFAPLMFRIIDITLGNVDYDASELIEAPQHLVTSKEVSKVHMHEWEAIRNAIVIAWAVAIQSSDEGVYDDKMHAQAAHYMEAVEKCPVFCKMPALYDKDSESCFFIQLFEDDEDGEDGETQRLSHTFATDPYTGAWAVFGSEDEAHKVAADALTDGWDSYKLRQPVGDRGFTKVVYDYDKREPFSLDD